MSVTHEVSNQVPPIEGYDAADDPTLRESLGSHAAALGALGRLVGSEWTAQRRRLADVHHPELRTHDRRGERIDEVEYHPAWHELMAVAVEHRVHVTDHGEPDAHLRRTARFLLWSQAEAGTCCPLTMTHAAVPVLRQAPELDARYGPGLTAGVYEFGLRPARDKRGLIAGMAMTEKQGGSDVRANTTRATPTADGAYVLRGHKWFCSAPMSDVFLVLAQAPGGLTCFLLPRVLPDGTRNAMRLARLKDKLGNRSNASSEVEYDDALAWRIGDEGRGVPTIIEMVNATRLDCLLGAAGGMRFATQRAVHHATHRRAFGRELVEQPLMRNVLADLVVESDAATALGMRLGAALDRGEDTFRRLAVAVGKYWVCKRWAPHATEALECLGGNGYVEEHDLARIHREAPLPSIWEGSGNVAALDVLRAMARTPETVEAFRAELATARGADARYDRALGELDVLLTKADEFSARRTVERMALTLQASLLLRHHDPAVADAFCAARLDRDAGAAFGTLPDGADVASIIGRARSRPVPPAGA